MSSRYVHPAWQKNFPIHVVRVDLGQNFCVCRPIMASEESRVGASRDTDASEAGGDDSGRGDSAQQANRRYAFIMRDTLLLLMPTTIVYPL